MSFPKISYKHSNTEVDYALQTVLENKMQSLEKYVGDLPVICDVEFEKMTSHNTGMIYRLECNLTIDGKLFRAESTEDSFEKAIDEVRAELDKELRRSIKKKESLAKKGGRKLKEMLRWGK